MDSVGLQLNMGTLDKADVFDPYTRVVINIGQSSSGEDLYIVSGNEEGRTLEVKCPWGTQKIADDMLKRIRRYSYQPYTASSALFDPAAELGDAVTSSRFHGGLYKQDITFDHLHSCDISAPNEGDAEHEFSYDGKDRNNERQFKQVRDGLQIAIDKADEALVRKGGLNTVFGWDLQTDKFSLYAKPDTEDAEIDPVGDRAINRINTETFYQEALRMDKNGLSIMGDAFIKSGVLGYSSDYLYQESASSYRVEHSPDHFVVGHHKKTSADKVDRAYIYAMHGAYIDSSPSVTDPPVFSLITYDRYGNVREGPENQSVYIGTDGITLGSLDSEYNHFTVLANGECDMDNLIYQNYSVKWTKITVSGQNYWVLTR